MNEKLGSSSDDVILLRSCKKICLQEMHLACMDAIIVLDNTTY